MCRRVLITVGILCFLSAARAKADDAVYAYCPLGEGYVFLYDSLTGFQVLANLKCGEKVTVVDARDKDRMRVRTADGKEGYVLKSSITAPPPGSQRQPAASAPNASSQQPQAQPQAQPQPQRKPEPVARLEPQPQPQLESQPQPQLEPQPQLQPEPQPQLGPQSQPQLESQPQPQLEPQPQLQTQPSSQPESLPKPQSQPQAQVQQQPQPAATAFTPFSTLGYEQNVPRLEAFGGFSYLNAGTSGLTARQNVAGFEGAVAIHLNEWVAGEANFGGYYKTLTILNVGTFGFHDYVAMAGPRFNIRRAFFHALVGIDHLAGSTNFYAMNTTSSNNALGGAVGGGVQWNVSRQWALRTSADYFLSRFEGLTQNNFRVTLGIVFQAGSVNNRGL